MRIFLFVFIMLFSLPAMAQDTASTAKPEAEQATRIEVDEEAGVIRFVVKGREAALLDETGLHVREEINFGGTMTDYGRAAFDERAAKSRGQGHAE